MTKQAADEGSDAVKDDTTIGEKYGPAMKITDQEEADHYFERCVEHCMRRFKLSREQAKHAERGNLGYYAGYFSHETRLRVERLFKCSHPILGAAASGELTPEEIFEKGRDAARESW